MKDRVKKTGTNKVKYYAKKVAIVFSLLLVVGASAGIPIANHYMQKAATIQKIEAQNNKK